MCDERIWFRPAAPVVTFTVGEEVVEVETRGRWAVCDQLRRDLTLLDDAIANLAAEVEILA